ncbi:MAG: alpha/beta fold hydrolase [Chroococcidiopsidaceae cyanobacterium CP_BM_RX_35]|nr:alpha/beta fold hydrolase [Chroococcidiopsidaceae cyanobacterium CP_BM_RX_35]
MSYKTIFVLIHGAWHGAWCYEKVAAVIKLQGYPVVARDLPGHGLLAKFPTSYFNRPLPLPGDFNTELSPVASVSLDDYVQQVSNIVDELAKQGSKVILVGHSIAGIILNAVGEKLGPELIQRLVYLTAFMPVSNSPITEILTRASQADNKVLPLLLADPAQVGALRIDFHSVAPAYLSLAKAAFYADISEEDFRAIANLLTPDTPAQPFNALVELSRTRWGRIPRTYIQCTQDYAIRPATQAQMIADIDAFTPGNPTQLLSLNSSHSPFFSQPKTLVNALIGLVKETEEV